MLHLVHALVLLTVTDYDSYQRIVDMQNADTSIARPVVNLYESDESEPAYQLPQLAPVGADSAEAFAIEQHNRAVHAARVRADAVRMELEHARHQQQAAVQAQRAAEHQRQALYNPYVRIYFPNGGYKTIYAPYGSLW